MKYPRVYAALLADYCSHVEAILTIDAAKRKDYSAIIRIRSSKAAQNNRKRSK